MRFTRNQYDIAIAALQRAKTQLEPDAFPCSICGDSGHMAFECGHNPLHAVLLCLEISKQSEQLHAQLHYLAGFDYAFGVQLGPAAIIVPED